MDCSFLGGDFKNNGAKGKFRITKTGRHVLHDEQGMTTLVGHEKLKFAAAIIVALSLKEEFTSVDCTIALFSTENSKGGGLLRNDSKNRGREEQRLGRGGAG